MAYAHVQKKKNEIYVFKYSFGRMNEFNTDTSFPYEGLVFLLCGRGRFMEA